MLTAVVALVFVLILLGLRVGLGLAPSILGASLVLALLRGIGLRGWLGVWPVALLTEQSLLLGSIVAAILGLSSLYAASGQSRRFLAAMRSRIRSRALLLAFFPALIGLLPMPGGAVFSAPMVAQAGQDWDLPAADMALINYWFRHIWELAWSLYPGVILAASLAQVPVGMVLRWMWPGPVVCAVLGWVFILRPVVRRMSPEREVDLAEDAGSLLCGLPLAVAIGGALVGEWLMGWLWPDRAMEWGVVAAMGLASMCSLGLARARWRQVLQEAAKENVVGLLAVVAAVLVFKETLSRAQVVDGLAMEWGGGAALVVLAVVLPLLVGSISGITMAFVGATFPLLFGLATSTGQESRIPALLCLGLFSGFAGIMISPMHICYLMSCRYFRVDVGRLWPWVALPGVLLIPVGLVAYWVLA